MPNKNNLGSLGFTSVYTCTILISFGSNDIHVQSLNELFNGRYGIKMITLKEHLIRFYWNSAT